MKSAGFDTKSSERRITAYRLIDLCDGDLQRAIDEVRLAFNDKRGTKLAGRGHPNSDTTSLVAASPPAKSEVVGHSGFDAHSANAPTSLSESNGAGQIYRDNQHTSASSLPTDKAKRPTQRIDVAAMKAAAIASAKTLLATMTTSDGTPWGEVGFYELDSMDRDGAIARSIKELYGSRIAQVNELRGKRLKELLTPDEFKQAVEHARERSNG